MKLASALIPLLATTAFAADNVRFDLDGAKESVPLEGPVVATGKGSASNPAWAKDKQPYFVSANFSVPAKTWTEVGVTFTPAKDGKVTITLRGPYKQKPGQGADGKKEMDPVLVTWDGVTAEGASVVNGSFEKLTDKEPIRPASWWVPADAKIAKVVSDGSAKDGSNAVLAWHNEAFGQTFAVKAGVPVTVKAWAWSETDPK